MKRILIIPEKYFGDSIKNFRNPLIITSIVVGTALVGTFIIRKIYFKTINDLVDEENKREDEKKNRITTNKIQRENLNIDLKKSLSTLSEPCKLVEKLPGLEVLIDKSTNKYQEASFNDKGSCFSLNNRPFRKKCLNSLSSYQINFSIENYEELILFSSEYYKRALKILEDVKCKKLDFDESKIDSLNELIDKTKFLIDEIHEFTKSNKVNNENQTSSTNIATQISNSPEGSVSSYYSLAFYDIEPNIHFFKLYMNALKNLDDFVIPRVDRSLFFNCESLDEFYAKVQCLRNGFDKIFDNEKNCDFFIKIGEYILKILVTQTKEQEECLRIYNDIIEFILKKNNLHILKEELDCRNIPLCNFYDLIIDYIILDSFEDLENPPSSIVSVINHRWLGDKFKIKALQTVINIVLKHKRNKLKIENGFFSRFYNLLEKISPILAWGFFGTDPDLKLKCNFIKQGIFQVLKDYFDFDRIRYTTLNDLAIDILSVTDIRYDDLQSKISIIV